MKNLSQWRGVELPQMPITEGRFIRIEPFEPARQAEELFDAMGAFEGEGPTADLWHFIPFGPFASAAEVEIAFSSAIADHGWEAHALRHINTGAFVGTASFMRNRSTAGSTEIGCIVFSRELQRTPGASEAIYLMARHIFESRGYRRLEWKCDNDNAPSKRAALRLGFTFEGIFRQDLIVKGRNRDTAWYSMLDSEWPIVGQAFEKWLAPENFGAGGAQRQSLAEIRAKL